MRGIISRGRSPIDIMACFRTTNSDLSSDKITDLDISFRIKHDINK
jgi:hypothetical protein